MFCFTQRQQSNLKHSNIKGVWFLDIKAKALKIELLTGKAKRTGKKADLVKSDK